MKAGGGIFSLPRQRQRPSSTKNCWTHTRRNVSTADSSANHAGASGSYTAVSNRLPSAPIVSANSRRWVCALSESDIHQSGDCSARTTLAGSEPAASPELPLPAALRAWRSVSPAHSSRSRLANGRQHPALESVRWRPRAVPPATTLTQLK